MCLCRTEQPSPTWTARSRVPWPSQGSACPAVRPGHLRWGFRPGADSEPLSGLPSSRCSGGTAFIGAVHLAAVIQAVARIGHSGHGCLVSRVVLVGPRQSNLTPRTRHAVHEPAPLKSGSKYTEQRSAGETGTLRVKAAVTPTVAAVVRPLTAMPGRLQYGSAGIVPGLAGSGALGRIRTCAPRTCGPPCDVRNTPDRSPELLR